MSLSCGARPIRSNCVAAWRAVLLVWLLAVDGAACSSVHASGAPDGSIQGDGGGLAEGAANPSDGGAARDAETEASSDVVTSGPGTIALGVRWIGRVDLSDAAAPVFAWSGTGFIAMVSGATISVKLKTVGSSDPIYFQPVIDHVAGDRFAVPVGEQIVTLAASLAAGDHVVELYRETEGRYGSSVFEGFTDGTAKDPPPFPGRLVEIVGDSISAGYGDLGVEQHPNYGPDPDGGCRFSTQTESAYATYGAIAARTLGADPSIVAVSGWGIYRDYGGSSSNVLPLVYADTLGLNRTPPWAFQPEPQAVVINLGTNDFATGDPGQTQFEGAYTAFIATLRGKYPDAWIFCTVGPLLYGPGLTMAQSYLQAVVAAAHGSGDMKVQYLDFGQQNTSLGTGCDYHPNTTEQQAMATKLVTALHATLGW